MQLIHASRLGSYGSVTATASPPRGLGSDADLNATTAPPKPPESALRITHLGKFFHPAHGGIEGAVRSLAHAQAALGCKVQVICMDHESGRATRVDRDGPVEVLRLRRTASYCKIDRCPDLPQAIRDCEADLLHLHTPNPSMILGLMLSAVRSPLLISHHSDVVKQRLRRMIFRPIERRCYDRADLVLAMSPPYIEGSSVLKRCGGRLDVLPIGLDLTPFLDPTPEATARGAALRRSIDGPIWFSGGRLVYYKGLETAIRALASVPGTLLIAGDGPHRNRLERLSDGLGLGRRVRFLGRIPDDGDLIAHYLAADAFWFPSNARSEAFGLVQVEAMAAGCPVINTSIPGSEVPWVSRHEESGLTVPVDAPPRVRRRRPPHPGGTRPARPPQRRRPRQGDRRVRPRGDGRAVARFLFRHARPRPPKPGPRGVTGPGLRP